MKHVTILLFFLMPLLVSAQRTTLDAENRIFLDEEKNEIIDEVGYLEREFPKHLYADYLFTDEIFKKCFGGKLKFNPNNVIRVDCPEGDVGTYTFQGWSECNYRRQCNFRAYIYWRGELIAQQEISSNQSFNITGSLGDLDIDGINAPTSRELRVVVYRLCKVIYGPNPSSYWQWRKVYDESSRVQIVGEGDTYIVRHEEGVQSMLLESFCELTPEVSDYKICCNPAYTELYRVDEFTKTTTSVGTTVTLNLAGKLGIAGISLTNTFSHNYSFGEHIIYRTDFALNAGLGECVYPGIQMYGRAILVEEYEVDCEFGYDILLNSHIDTVVTKYLPVECMTEPCNADECNNTSDDVEIDSGTGANLRADENCEGYINLSAAIGDIGDYTIAIEGPNGFQSNNPINEGIALGRYDVYISDSCCDGMDTAIYLCNSLTYGAWMLNDETNEYCREVICGTCDDGDSNKAKTKADVSYTECITPQTGPCTFNTTTKLCEYNLILDGQVIGTVTSIPEVVDEFDDFFEECTRTYYCDNIMKFSEDQDPEYEEWQYDDFFEECYREITCFGVTQPEGEEVNATFVWSYDDFFEECVGVVYCKDDALDEEETEDPEIIWDYDDFFNECEGIVVCDGSQVDETTTEPQIVSCTYDAFWGTCQVEVTCDGSAIFEDEESISGGVIVYTQDGIDYCEIYCCGEPTGVIVPCSGLAAKPDGVGKGQEEKSYSQILITPNPVKDELTIYQLPINEQLHMTITDAVTGRIIFDKRIIPASGQLKLNIDQANNGTYLVRVTNRDGTASFNQKIVKTGN